MCSHMAREKFDFNARADRDSGIRKAKMVVIQMIRQMSSWVHTTTFLPGSIWLSDIATCTKGPRGTATTGISSF